MITAPWLFTGLLLVLDETTEGSKFVLSPFVAVAAYTLMAISMPSEGEVLPVLRSKGLNNAFFQDFCSSNDVG